MYPNETLTERCELDDYKRMAWLFSRPDSLARD